MQIRLEARSLARTRERVGFASMLAVCAVSVSLTACGSSSSKSGTSAKANVNTAQVQRSIQESILAQRHLPSTVVCPSLVPAEKGKTFECVATTRSLKKPFKPVKTPFVVTIQNNRGGVTYVGK